MNIFNSTTDSEISNWKIINDSVMGGQSKGDFKLNTAGVGEFYGKISLANNGGFTSLHYTFETKETQAFSKFLITLKGDGKAYKFRVKNKRSDRHSYSFKFKTTKAWQLLEVPFLDMQPVFRGKTLEFPNFNGIEMEALAFLIGNKQEEHFKLQIESINLI